MAGLNKKSRQNGGLFSNQAGIIVRASTWLTALRPKGRAFSNQAGITVRASTWLTALRPKGRPFSNQAGQRDITVREDTWLTAQREGQNDKLFSKIPFYKIFYMACWQHDEHNFFKIACVFPKMVNKSVSSGSGFGSTRYYKNVNNFKNEYWSIKIFIYFNGSFGNKN